MEHDSARATWFNENLDEIPKPMEKLLREYAGIPADQIKQHVLGIRDRAFQVCSYPCIGQLRFLVLVLEEFPIYESLLSDLKFHNKFYLDLGVGFGQDLRQLVFHGVPSTQTVAIDVDPTIVEFGLELFNDRKSLQTKFIIGDVTEPWTMFCDWSLIAGKMDYIHASGFFTLWDWGHALQVACNVVRLLRPEYGSRIIGRQAGSVEAREARGIWEGQETYFHNPESWNKFWKEVEKLTNVQFKVESWLDDVAINGLGKKDKDTNEDEPKDVLPPYHFDAKRRLMFVIMWEKSPSLP